VPAWRRPWTLSLVGLGAVIGAIVLSNFTADALVPVRLALIAASLILSGVAIQQRLRHGVTDLEDRTEPACLVGLGAIIAFLASLAFDPSWNSGVMFARVLGAFALFGACLVALPSLLRKVLASLLILFHFGAILTAVTAVSPAGGASAPWLSVEAWGYVYHPYLQFMYLNNAYHFYSPEPGPPTLLWFRVRYKSGKSRWVKLPSRKESPIPMHYMRHVAMSETFFDQEPVTQEQFNRISAIRGQMFGYPTHPGIPAERQYAPLSSIPRLLLSSYVRHVAMTSPNPDDPNDPVELVKAYRVTHRILSPEEFDRGMNPLDKTTYQPFYCGDFDAEGHMLNKPDDPMLYWLIPIYQQMNGTKPTGPVFNFLKVHAGDAKTPEEEP
jgi:hypothetical protein